MESDVSSSIETWTAANRSDCIVVTGETGREDFQSIATPPQPLVRSELSVRRLSKQPWPLYPGITWFREETWYGHSQCSDIVIISWSSESSCTYGIEVDRPRQFQATTLSPGRQGEFACSMTVFESWWSRLTGVVGFSWVLSSACKWDTDCLRRPTSSLKVESGEYAEERELTHDLNDCNSFFMMFISFMRLVSAKLDWDTSGTFCVAGPCVSLRSAGPWCALDGDVRVFSNVVLSRLPFLRTERGSTFLCLRQSEIVQTSSTSFIRRGFAAVSFLLTRALSADTKFNSTASANSESLVLWRERTVSGFRAEMNSDLGRWPEISPSYKGSPCRRPGGTW